jgi:hypothetical protein
MVTCKPRKHELSGKSKVLATKLVRRISFNHSQNQTDCPQVSKSFAMLLEDQRFLHEDLERLEIAITDRIGDEPKNVKHLSPRSVDQKSLLDLPHWLELF